jgi:amino acid adenylation domain-containing protein
MMGHREVVQYACCLPETMPLGPGDRVAQASNASFDAAVFEIWGALLNGATLVGIDRDVLLSAPLLGRALREQGITHLYQTAALFNQHVREQVDVYAGLRQLVFGAEAVGTESVRRMLREGKPARVLHEYGPTEATVWCTLEEVREVAEDAPTVLIGVPVPNARGYVLDPAGEPLPLGVPGELCIGGAGVVRGYLGRPGLTAERFVPDPFAAEPGGRMYRTGDRARWKAEGKLEFLGRLDDQVKIRGFRIEPGEVEAAIVAYPGVREARVMMREDQPGDKRLVAYVVGGVEVDGLRAHLRRSLPEYMVPRAIVALDRLPLNANGKVDRKALPVPEYAADADRYVAPRTPAEEVLAGIWAEVLGVERVGVEESFFELGGHSLLATRLVSRVREVFGVEVPLRALFEGPTVAELAGRVEEMRRAELPLLPPVVPVERDGALPLSFAQERLWFIDRLDPESAAYNIPVAMRLGGVLDEAAMERSLSEIVRRHEALRTTFAEVDGSPVQVIAPFGAFALAVGDLSGLSEADREAAARRRAAEEAGRPFDLSAGPLFRAVLLRLGAEDHVLLLSMHHIVSDGWSMGVLFRELSALYEAYREGGESPLPALAVQYADYAVWQREQLAGEVLDRQLAYWRERLAGAPELLELPTDHPRPPAQTYRGASVPVELSPELLERLQALGRSEGATLYMTLLGAFQVLLGKYSGGEDIVVGSPIAGRTRAEVEELIGFFVNTLVLRTDLSGDPSFRAVLRRVREATLGAYEHQEVPFEKLVAELQPERSMSHSPLFQVLFTLQDDAGGGGALPGLKMSGAGPATEIAKFDLSLDLAATPQGLRGGLNYSTDLFERGTALRMLGHLARVLEQVAADADVRLSQLELLGQAERALVLDEWNRTEAEYPADRCIHELFEVQAARTPGAMAVRFEEESLTYRELNERANQLAHHLRRRGVGPEVRVGICLERSLEMVVGILAVLKAGGAYVPLDPGSPAERLAFILADSATPVLLTRETLRGALPVREGVEVVSLDGAAEEIATESAENPQSGAGPDSLAYVIYTSGSTGAPKGALIEHRNVARLFAATDAWFGFGEGDVWTLFHSYAFDFSVWELWGALLYGGRVVVVPFEVSRDPEAFHALVQREGVTVLNQTPSAFRQFIRVDGERGGELALRVVVFGGEALEPASLRVWVERRGAETPRLVNMYGITETTVHVTWRPLSREDVLEGGGSPIGVRIPDLQLYVLDPARKPVPIGVPGELYVGGAGVARGYLNRPELTAERFVDDPFAPGRLYRTGDRVRWMADGTLEYLGRLDEQVKIRGFRIELGEIEAALRQASGVRDCAVVVREDEPGDRRLVAYVVGEAEAEALRDRLRRSLPEYMLPAAFVFLDALPLTSNGKLDRKALPVPGYAADADRYVAPRTPVEEVLAGIWAEVLRLERVGVEESFFDLGGHSLLATRLVSRVREVFGVEVPLRALFEGPTVAELAGCVEEMRRAELPLLPPMVPVEREGALPLSFAQERLWFLDRLQPGSTTYNVPVAWRLGGALDGPALERSLSEIVRRHEGLRTTFSDRDGTPVQVVAPFGGFTLPVEDLSGLSEADREAAVRRRADEEAGEPFDLSEGPLFRAALLRLGADDHALLLSMHHIVSDGWSLDVLFRELSALYAAYREGGESPLAELAVQYADYAVWQREQLEGEVLDRQLSYWRERLASAPELLELPTDRPRPAVQTFRGATVPFELSPELLERLRALGRSEGTTLYMTLLGAFQVLLSRYGGGEDIVVGSPIAGRTRREVEELIGFFVNTLVLRTDLSGDPSFREVLRRVRETTLGAYEHQEVPFERLVAELQPERSMSHSPLFQVMFTLQDAGGGGGALPGLKVGGLGAAMEIAKFDLSLTAGVSAQGLRGELNYSTDLFERDTIVRMLGHLSRVLEQVAADAEVSLSRLALAGPEERARVVAEWNRTGRAYPRGVCVHDLFEAQVRERPGAVALAWGDAELTYRELDAAANRLANHLVRLGVGADARVGVLLERSAELIVSILAVLKAGGAYVPLDPSYPPERLRLMLADSGVRVLLSRGELAGEVGGGDLEIVHLDHAADALASEPIEAPRSGATAESLAYIVYTSGSTGKPKGVMVAHRHVVQLVVETDYVRIRPGDRVAQASNASFDALTFEAWGAFLNGATLVGIPRDVLLSPPALYRMLRDERITTLYQTTALLNQLSRELPDVFAPLRDVLFGGQAVDADSVRRLLKAGGPERLLHMYGPTETTAWCSWEQVTHVAEDALTVSVGRPTGNQRIYLLDSALDPVPVGVPGEAYVGGDGVVRGYLDRPGLTAERFVPDPFAAEPGARMYRTGDRLRWKADGRLEFIGRVDEQVKIRGFRIEPGEIEAVLSAHAEVREARVIVGEDASGEKRLVAYVVGRVEADELRAHLRESLPEYMVPAAFVVLETLPLTPNGKLDVRALPTPEYAADVDRYVAPRTPAEEVLAGIWAEVLRLERVGVQASFFELGGHSLMAIRVVSRIRALFAIELPLRALFEGPTVAELAGRVEDERRRELPVLPPVVPVERTGAPPLSFAQERLWFIDRLDPDSAAYNIPVALRLGGVLDEAAMERSLSEIVRRHEALRTTFAEVDGSPVQVIAPFGGFALAVEDLSGLSEADREVAVRRRAAEEAGRPFDLSEGPLFRAALLRLGGEDHALLLSMHHIVSDGWSMGVLFRELSALYEAYREGRESPLPGLAVQYADYAAWQREHLRGEMLELHLSYWRDRLADAPALLELPIDHPRPAVQTFRGASEPIELPGELLERLRGLGRSEGATLYMVVLAAFQALLSRYSGSEDIVVGSPIAGRTRREVEELIGFFVNTLVLRTDLGGDPSFREVLGRVREATLGAYEHQELPFEKLVAELQPERSLSHSPLFQVSFTLGDAEEAAGGLAELSTAGVDAGFEPAKFDLLLALVATRRGLRGGLSYRTDLFERGTIVRLLGHLERVLEQVAEDASLRLSQVDLLGEAERALVLEEWNRTAAEYPADRCIHELFEAQAARTPGAVAVVFEGAELTYGALNGRANRLAHHLAGLGVGPETRVGICLERGTETIVSVLAVLKAGGAYVPLDPAYPAERLAFVLADAAVPVLVTQESLRAALPAGHGVAVVSVDGDGERIAAESEQNPERGVSPDHLAYVIHTSGSTGTPKGVMVSHRGVPNLARVAAARIGIDGASRVLQFASLSFDAAVWEVFSALLAGATLVLAPREKLLPGPGLLETLRRGRVTVATLPPSVLAILPPDDLPELRTVVSAGEAVDAATVERWSAGRAFVNAYGPTEVTVCATSAACEADGRVPAIGRALENVRVYVLDAAGRPAPVGVPGELYVGGVGVARGYLGRPGLTAEKFVPDPFPAGAGGRLYRTGDRARWRAAGELEFLGRVDQQLKVRGFRVEPGEVEAALRAHPGVRDAVVVARGEREAAGLVGYVTPAGVDVDEVLARLSTRLPAYLVPSALVALAELPRTANGKVDRRALPGPEVRADAFVAPRTPTEEAIAAIWSGVLGRSPVGAHDNFFAVGGQSLRGMQVLNHIEARFGVRIPVKTLFTSPTVAGLAEAVEAAGGGGALAEALAGLDNLNEDELAALLAELGEEA